MWACTLIKTLLIKLIVFHALSTSALQVLLQMTTLLPRTINIILCNLHRRHILLKIMKSHNGVLVPGLGAIFHGAMMERKKQGLKRQEGDLANWVFILLV